MEPAQSKTVEKWKHENKKPEPSAELANPMEIEQLKENQQPKPKAKCVTSLPLRRLDQYVALHRAALKGDWETAKKLLEKNSNLINARITEGGLTALHIAAAEGHAYFVEELLKRMGRSDLEILNGNQTTALCFAAAIGHVPIAELMVKNNKNLPTIRGEKGFTPLYMAVWEGHKEMAEYLFGVSIFKSWAEKDKIEILTRSIHSGLYDLALKIVQEYNMLAVAKDNNGETPLQVLASKPLAFCGTNQQQFWGSIASTILSCKKMEAGNKSAQCDAYKLFECLWRNVTDQEDVEATQLPEQISELLFIAAESGNDGFLVELIKRYPNFIYKVNSSNHSIFHIAVSKRYVEVFNLIYELHGVKDLMILCIDKDGNNILHLAAKLAPPHQLNSVPGAAFQMQREVLWYKEVEKIVHPSFRDMKNKAGQTPYQLFLKKHKNLMQEGEKQMKQIAKSSMLVAMLIAAVVYTTAFIVPGDYDNKGIPNLQNKKQSMIFPISEALAILASVISMLMFLSVLICRYSDNDFLSTLPFLLVVGVAALFVSIVAMMVAFCSCLTSYNPGHSTIITLPILFAIVPVMFVRLKYPLLITIVRCAYSSKWLFRSRNRFS